MAWSMKQAGTETKTKQGLNRSKVKMLCAVCRGQLGTDLAAALEHTQLLAA